MKRFMNIIKESSGLSWPGEIRWPALGESMMASDLYVCASLSESYGMAMMEAAGFGVVPVVIGKTGAADIINERGIGVNLTDLHGLGDLLAAIGQDRDWLDSQRQRLLLNWRKNTWQHQAQSFHTFLDAVALI